ncbi:MAG: hypothetical protein WDO15_03285 [Bacteroidota bacterium]
MEEFKERAKAQNLNIYDSNNTPSNERYVGQLGDGREMITWLFREAKVGKVSNVFTLDRDYTVAVMTSKADEGYRPLDDALKAEITVFVKKEKQGKEIISKLSGDASLDDLAKAFPGDAVVSSSSDVKLNAHRSPTSATTQLPSASRSLLKMANARSHSLVRVALQ